VEGVGHMAGGEWMMRWGRDHIDQKEGRWTDVRG
jgi:hypothetical protein